MTDDNGRFAVHNLVPGKHRVFVMRNGFIRAEYGQRGPNKPGVPVELVSGASRSGIAIEMIPTGAISGRTLDPEGKPMRGVFVRISRTAYPQGESTLEMIQRLQTNDLGEFRFYGLNPGQYIVQAVPPQSPRIDHDSYIIPSTASPDSLVGIEQRFSAADALARGIISANVLSTEAYKTVYYPNTTELSAAVPVPLAPGGEISGLELRMVRSALVHVRGRVLSGINGRPDPAFTVSISARESGTDSNGGGGSQNADGTFDFDVPPGDYRLGGQNVKRGPGDLDLWAAMPLVVGDKDLDDVTLYLRPSFSMKGRVVIEGRPAGAVDPDFGRVIINLPSSSGVQGVRPGMDGTFTLTNVRPGDYRFLGLRLPPNFYMKSAHLGAADVLASGFSVSSAPEESLEIVLSPNGASLNGVVLDQNQNPVQGATIASVPSEPSLRIRRDMFRSGTSDASGHFSFDSVPAGDFKAFAWDDILPNSWQDPEILRPYEARGTIVHLREGAKEDATLRVIP